MWVGLGWVEFFFTHHGGLGQKIPSTWPNPTHAHPYSSCSTIYSTNKNMSYFHLFYSSLINLHHFIYGFERFGDILNRNQGVKIVKRKEDIFYSRAHCLLLFNSPRTLAILGIMGVHGSSWVRLRGFFDPTHHGGSKKFSLTQPIT